MNTPLAKNAIAAFGLNSYEELDTSCVFAKAHGKLIDGIVELANCYPHEHSVLGTNRAEQYVRGLAERSDFDQTAGWYCLCNGLQLRAAAHLSIYGRGDESGHTLWKIRHPLSNDDSVIYGSVLLQLLSALALRIRSGTAKLVLFLSELEGLQQRQALQAGFECEGQLRDYYRLGEVCLVYGKTMAPVGNKTHAHAC